LSILVILRTIIVRLHPAGPLAHLAVLAVTLGAIVVFGMAVYRFYELPVTRFLNAKLPSRPPRAAIESSRIARAVPEAAAE
jgi:peptidoglycan/LPS O-acetylase OafA/YrhL